MEMEQMMEHLLTKLGAEMKTNQERLEAKIEAGIKTIREEMDSHHEGLIAIMKVSQVRMEASQE
jgi:hypothetical protein